MSPLRFVLPLVLFISASFANAYSFAVNRNGADLVIRHDTLALRSAIVEVMESFIAGRIGRALTLARIIAGAVTNPDHAVVISDFFVRLPEATEEEIEAAINERLERGDLPLL